MPPRRVVSHLLFRATLLWAAIRVVWPTAGTTHGLGSPSEAREHPQFLRQYLGPARVEAGGPA